MLFKRLRSILLPLAVSLPLSALAGPFSSLVVFGDSLSDTGNLTTANAVANSLRWSGRVPLWRYDANSVSF